MGILERMKYDHNVIKKKKKDPNHSSPIVLVSWV